MTADPLPVALPELPTVAWADDDDLLEERPELCAIQDSRRHTNMRYDVALVRKSDAEAALRAQAEEVAALRALLRECQDAIDWCAHECGHRAAHELATRIDVHLAASKQEKPHG